jgi:sodium/potassium-transporting ATPase subunit alpha
MFSVNERSILTRKKRALRHAKTLRHDSETQEQVPPSKISVFISKMKAPFTRVFWEDMFEGSDDETLVDGKLMSYSYIEAGLIETVGS